MSDVRTMLEASFRHALRETDAGRLVRRHLPGEEPALVLAVGKAALPMVAEAVRAYPNVPWLATPPAGAPGPRDVAGAGLDPARIVAGSHPLPGQGSVEAAERALSMVAGLSPADRLLVLVSGGGSALWAAPWHAEGTHPAVGLAEKREATAALQRAGADIHQLNTVRRHLSRIKGGRLAAATPGPVLTLALSDVPGDALEDIASGPTVPDPTTYADALEVVRSFPVRLSAVTRLLERGAAGQLPETPKPGSAASRRWEARIIGSARKLLEAAADFWRSSGFQPVLLSDRLQGEASVLAEDHAALVGGLAAGRVHQASLARLTGESAGQGSAREAAESLRQWLAQERRPPLVLLSGGEATVTVKGEGKGGRNLEFAGWLLHHLPRTAAADAGHAVWALSAGSDGVDGSSEAAGAFVTPDSAVRLSTAGAKLGDYLARNDSDALFAALGDRLVTGPTGNNLNDYRALLVLPQREGGVPV